MDAQAMSVWDKISIASGLVQAVAVIVSLVFIAYQTRKQTKLIKASNMQVLATLIAPLNLKLAEDPELARLWFDGPKRGTKQAKAWDEDVDEYRYNRMLANFLMFYENAQTQHDQGLLDKDVFDGWLDDLDGFLENFVLEHEVECWNDRKSSYRPAFRDLVDNRIKVLKSRLRAPDS